jgi:hypothetical protein
MATPVTVEIAVGYDVDQHVEAILAASKSSQQLVTAPARPYRDFKHFHLSRRAPLFR